VPSGNLVCCVLSRACPSLTTAVWICHFSRLNDNSAGCHGRAACLLSLLHIGCDTGPKERLKLVLPAGEVLERHLLLHEQQDVKRKSL